MKFPGAKFTGTLTTVGITDRPGKVKLTTSSRHKRPCRELGANSRYHVKSGQPGPFN